MLAVGGTCPGIDQLLSEEARVQPVAAVVATVSIERSEVRVTEKITLAAADC